MLDHCAISSSVRAQPRQKPVFASIVHTNMQGDSIFAVSMKCNVVASKGHDKSDKGCKRAYLLRRTQRIAGLSADFCHAQSGKTKKHDGH